MASYVYPAIALIGGGTGALDAIDGAALADKDMAYVTVGNFTYFYILDVDSAAAESSPAIVQPNANGGDKRWILKSMYPFAVTAAGEVTNATQPAFLAIAAVQTDVTGDNTTYVPTFGTEIFDQGADFDGSSTFTAPVAGRYQFNLTLFFNGLASTHTAMFVQIVTSNRTRFTFDSYAPYAMFSQDGAISGSTFADMDAADTATILFIVYGTGKSVDLTTNSHFSGFLVC